MSKSEFKSHTFHENQNYFQAKKLKFYLEQNPKLIAKRLKNREKKLKKSIEKSSEKKNKKTKQNI